MAEQQGERSQTAAPADKQSPDQHVLSTKSFFFFLYQLMLKNTDLFYKNSTIFFFLSYYTLALLLVIHRGREGGGRGFVIPGLARSLCQGRAVVPAT